MPARTRTFTCTCTAHSASRREGTWEPSSLSDLSSCAAAALRACAAADAAATSAACCACKQSAPGHPTHHVHAGSSPQAAARRPHHQARSQRANWPTCDAFGARTRCKVREHGRSTGWLPAHAAAVAIASRCRKDRCVPRLRRRAAGRQLLCGAGPRHGAAAWPCATTPPCASAKAQRVLVPPASSPRPKPKPVTVDEAASIGMGRSLRFSGDCARRTCTRSPRR